MASGRDRKRRSATVFHAVATTKPASSAIAGPAMPIRGVRTTVAAIVTASRESATKLLSPGRSTAHRACVWVAVIEDRAGNRSSSASAGVARLKPGPNTSSSEWAAPPHTAAITSIPTSA